MGRLLIWIALIAAVYWFWRRATRPRPAAATPQADTAEPMVRCAHCGVHTPRANALNQGKQWFCSQAHLEQGAAHSER